MSSGFPNASICLEKTYSKPKSLLIAVIQEGSTVRDIAGRGCLSLLNLQIISAAK